MLDKRKFDLEMEQVRRDQIEDMAEYLKGYLSVNSHIRERKIVREPDMESLKILDDTPIPRKGRDPKVVADEMIEHVYQKAMVTQHPRFFSFVPSAVSPYSLAGSILTDIYNPFSGGFNYAAGAGLIEEKLIAWMASLAGYPKDTAGGVFVSGGSIATMTALIAARNNKLKETEYPQGVAYLSDQTHSSVAKGLRMIGFRSDQIVILPSDDDFKMRVDLLEEAIKKDKAAGKKPFCVIGTVGTTNTGSIDPLNAIAAIAKEHGLWMHVDGAYGGSILMSDIYRNLAKGIENSDSLSWDTHKWALQTYSCSTVLVRDKNTLLEAFTEHPEYLEDVRSSEHNDSWDLGPEMSRPHRCLKLWFTLQAMGTDRMADVIDYSFFNARQVEKGLRAREGWEITSKPMCGAITFRFVPDGFSDEELDALCGAISERTIEDGFTYIVTSTLKGKRVLRMCLINGNTTDQDVTDTVEYLDRIAREIAASFKK